MEEDSDDDLHWDKPQDFGINSPENPARCRKFVSAKQILPRSEHPRVILHIDIDCFYAQVEMIRNPGLSDKPLGIQQKYIVVTCNYPAREYGVTKLMSIKDAKEKCPSLVLVNGEDLTHYRHMSYKISEYLQQYCDKVERLGFDENFLDVTEQVNDRIANQHGKGQGNVSGHVYGEEPSVLDSCSCGCHERLRVGSQLAADIREGLNRELGITCCGGIAHNKLLSKLVAGSHKPNQQTTLFPENTGSLMHSLKSVRNIPGIGHTTSKQLKEMGIESITDLQDTEQAVLKKVFGDAVAMTMKQLVDGIDEAPVVPYSLPQTLSDEDSFKKCSSIVEVQHKIKELITSLLKRLLEDGRTPTTFRLTVRKMSATNKYLNRESRQCAIPSTVFRNFSQDKIPQTCGQLGVLAVSLFNKLVNTREPFHLTLINVAFAKMEEKSKNSIANFFTPKSSNQNTGTNSSSSPEAASPTDNITYTKQEQGSKHSVDVISDGVKGETDEADTKKTVTDMSDKTGPNKPDSGKKTLFHWLSAPKGSAAKSKGPGTESVSERSGGLPEERTKLQDSRTSLSTKSASNCTNLDSRLMQLDAYVAKTEVSLQHDIVREIKHDKDSAPAAKKQSEKRKSDDNYSLQNVLKRPKLTTNFDVLIPDHIDKAVFYQLPPTIQQEILSIKDSTEKIKSTNSPQISGLQGTKSSSHATTYDKGTSEMEKTVPKNHTETNNNRSATRETNLTTHNSKKSEAASFFKSKFKNSSGKNSNSEQSYSSGIKSIYEQSYNSGMKPNTEQSYHEHVHDKGIKPTSNSVRDEDTASRDMKKTDNLSEGASVLYEPCSSKTEVLSEKFRKADTIVIPPDVDRETFLSLPSDIQQEYITEWKAKSSVTHQRTVQNPQIPHQPKTQQKPQTQHRPPHFKMPEKSSSNSILSYFPKANR